MDRDGLVAGAYIAAVIRCFPGTCDYVVACAASRSIGIGIGDNRCRITIICCCGCACIGGQYRILTVDRYIRRTGYYWRSNIMDGDGLNAGAHIAAVVRCLPGTCDHVVACTTSRSIGIGIGDNW